MQEVERSSMLRICGFESMLLLEQMTRRVGDLCDIVRNHLTLPPIPLMDLARGYPTQTPPSRSRVKRLSGGPRSEELHETNASLGVVCTPECFTRRDR